MSVTDFVLGDVDAPEVALEFGATLLIDTLGVAAGAAPMEAGRIARDHAVRFMGGTGADAATMLFDGRQASLPGAAFAAATQIDNLDAHDGLNETKGHIGCAVVPALCTFAEGRSVSARAALEALVMAYEVSARAAVALHGSVSDYHTSGAWNALGVAALGARLRGLSAYELRQAFGIAEYHGPRSQMMREIANPTMLHDGSGMGAMVGTMAVLLAEDGFTGAPAVTVEDVTEAWADLGSRWTILENYIKPYPICRWAHASLDALGAVMAGHGLGAGDIAQVEVGTFAEAAALFPDMPATSSQAQYSLRFALASLAVKGQVGPSEIMGDALRDPEVAAVLPRIEVREIARHSAAFPAHRISDVTVVTADGRRLASGDVHASGGPEAPMGMAAVEAKFHRMAVPLAARRRQAIWALRGRLTDPEVPFSDLLNLLHPAPEAN